MKIVDIESIVKWRKHHPSVRCPTFYEITDNYYPSSKVTKTNLNTSKRKTSQVPQILDESLGVYFDDEKRDTEKIFKSVTMALNKITSQNVEDVFKDLQNIVLTTYQQQEKVALFFVKKLMNEVSFRKHYLNAIERLPWFSSLDGFLITFKDQVVIEIQRHFEMISSLSKDEAVKLMEILGDLYDRAWVSLQVFDKIIKHLLDQTGNTYLEYVVVFLRNCPNYRRHQAISHLLLEKPSFPMRLKMILQTIPSKV
jgi:hypothetical protein